MKMIDCFLQWGGFENTEATVAELKASGVVNDIYILALSPIDRIPDGCRRVIDIDSLRSTSTVKKIAESANAEYTLLYTGKNHLRPGYLALCRMTRIADDSHAGMVYADYYAVKEGRSVPSPVIDCQEGSLRDDFDFGTLLMFDTDRKSTRLNSSHMA